MTKKEAKKKLEELEKNKLLLLEIINKPEDLFNIIKNYKDVCTQLDIEELTIDDLEEAIPKEQRKKILAIHKLLNIQKLFNGNWKANFKDNTQRKWYPWYSIGHGGLVFTSSSTCCSSFFGEVGFYKDKEISDFCGKLFIDLYKDLE